MGAPPPPTLGLSLHRGATAPSQRAPWDAMPRDIISEDRLGCLPSGLPAQGVGPTGAFEMNVGIGLGEGFGGGAAECGKQERGSGEGSCPPTPPQGCYGNTRAGGWLTFLPPMPEQEAHRRPPLSKRDGHFDLQTAPRFWHMSASLQPLLVGELTPGFDWASPWIRTHDLLKLLLTPPHPTMCRPPLALLNEVGTSRRPPGAMLWGTALCHRHPPAWPIGCALASVLPSGVTQASPLPFRVSLILFAISFALVCRG